MPRSLNLKPKDVEALREFSQKVRMALCERLVSLKLFGSKARGQDEPESDIDILVVVSEGSVEVEDQVLDIAFQVSLAHDVYISPRVITHTVLDDRV